MLGSLILYLKGMRTIMFQLSGFYYRKGIKAVGAKGFRGFRVGGAPFLSAKSLRKAPGFAGFRRSGCSTYQAGVMHYTTTHKGRKGHAVPRLASFLWNLCVPVSDSTSRFNNVHRSRVDDVSGSVGMLAVHLN